jgi:hypothetical protein
MSTHPIDIIANALRATDDVRDDNGMADRARAVTAANALDNLHIIRNAVAALKAEGWTSTPEGPHGEYRFADDELADIAAVVLRSVGGA